MRDVSRSEIVIVYQADLSGITAMRGTNNVRKLDLAFDDIHEMVGSHRRWVRLIVDDTEYLVSKRSRR